MPQVVAEYRAKMSNACGNCWPTGVTLTESDLIREVSIFSIAATSMRKLRAQITLISSSLHPRTGFHRPQTDSLSQEMNREVNTIA